MGFSQSSILDITAAADPSRCVLSLTWKASDAIGSGVIYQVYVNRQLAWHGQSRQVDLPYAGAQISQRIDIGTVGPGQGSTDFSSSLPASPGTGDRPTLTWLGGKYLDPSGAGNVVGFYVYAGSTPGGAVGSNPIATVSTYSGGTDLSGYGMGGYGQGVYGSAATTYSWTGASLKSGTWNFAVSAFDSAGNVGPQSPIALTISAPPNPPAPNAAGIRLTHTYPTPSGYGSGGYGSGGYGTTGGATLNWLAST